jgi:hypothetical protein
MLAPAPLGLVDGTWPFARRRGWVQGEMRRGQKPPRPPSPREVRILLGPGAPALDSCCWLKMLRRARPGSELSRQRVGFATPNGEGEVALGGLQEGMGSRVVARLPTYRRTRSADPMTSSSRADSASFTSRSSARPRWRKGELRQENIGSYRKTGFASGSEASSGLRACGVRLFIWSRNRRVCRRNRVCAPQACR